MVRWRKVDDPLLVMGMQQVGSIVTLYQTTKFSRPYSLRELKERWRVLLMDSQNSRCVGVCGWVNGCA